jgi:4-hydroxybenzoate polyprenyltransferase
MQSSSIKTAIRMLGPVLWLAFAAGLQMLGALLFFHTSSGFILITTYFFIAFGIYLFNRFTDKEDCYNSPAQKMYFQRRPFLKAIPIVLIVASIIILAISDHLVLWHVVLICGGIVYSASIFPFFKKKSFCFIRLKDILIVKNIVVGVLWGIPPFAIAAGQKTSIFPSQGDLFVIVSAFCLASFIDSISCDVIDMNGDRFAGLSTLPTRLGKKMTALLLSSTAIGACVLVGLGLSQGKIGVPPALLFLIILAWTGVITFLVFSGKITIAKSLIKPLLDTECVFCGFALIVYSLAVK